MERLTTRVLGTDVITFKGERFEDTTVGEMTQKDIIKMKSRLADYEDTNLTPEQIREIDKLYLEKCQEVAQLEKEKQWIPVEERLPDCEVEVQITARRKFSDGTCKYIITNAIYEDGTMLEDESAWNWNECNFEEYDEENDCYIIDAGWWEYKHYNHDDVYNNAVDDEVIAWMPKPLAEPYDKYDPDTGRVGAAKQIGFLK